jgi:hypothetical protein
MHKDDRVEVAQGRFTNKGIDVDLTRLESGMSFLQVKASMTMKKKLMQVRNDTPGRYRKHYYVGLHCGPYTGKS